ncbi:MAG: methyltransferase domain-containing protein [Candidatus Omnitrophica bacterium]|nr:methyltransferase domain-containing protein [Candidatus Omnitrophota bacterium]
MSAFKHKYSNLLKLAKQTYWKDALKQELKEKQPFRYERLMYNAAADWVYLIPLNKESVVLDAGSGWGVLSFQIANHCKSVVSMDDSPAAVEFIKIRAAQDNVKNVEPLLGSVLKLSFKDGCFDLVVLNGILEWAGISDLSKDPKAVQEDFLKEVFRVLKPGGCVYLGIENRWSATYMAGRPEGHVNIKFISLLPRFIAKIYHRLIKKSEYRVYTHSLRNYKQMLKSAGFKEISVYAPLPEYQRFSYLAALEKPDFIKYYFKNLFTHKKKLAIWFSRFVIHLNLYKLVKYFVPCYSFIAAKGDLTNDFDEFIKSRKESLLPQPIQDFGKSSYILRSGINNIVLLVFNKKSGRPLCVFKMNRNHSQELLDVENTSLKILSSVEKSSSLLKSSFPKALHYGLIGSHKVLVQSLIDGKNFESLIINKANPLWKIGLKKKLYRVLDWLIELQKSTAERNILLQKEVLNKYICEINKAFDEYADKLKNKQALTSKLNSLRQKVEGKSMPLVLQHRDLGPSNIFVKNNRIMVLDWEVSRIGSPFYDLYFFLSHYFFFVFYDPAQDAVADFKTMAKFKERMYFKKGDYAYKIIREALDYYCRRMGLDYDVAEFMFLYWEAVKFKSLEVLEYFAETDWQKGLGKSG